MKPLTPSQTIEFVIDALMMKEVAYIAGVPAIGKSSVIKQVAKQFNLKLITEYLSQKLPEDLTGLPTMNEKTKKAEYIPFDTFPLEGDVVPDGYDGWLIFLDELSSSSQEIMAAVYSLILERTIGGRKLHPKALMVAAGNRSTDSAIARALPDTLITRMLVCEMKTDSTNWLAWAAEPENNGHTSVISFITKYPDLLLGTVKPENRAELETYPTPRGWEKMFKIVKLHEKKSKNTQLTRKDSAGVPVAPNSMSGSVITSGILNLMNGAIGVTGAKSFQEHYDESIKLPYPWEIAQSPGSSRIPDSTIGKAKLTADLAEHFLDTQDQSRDAILQYMNRMDKEHSALFAQIIAEKLGDTVSDRALVDSIKKRLKVQLLDPMKAAPDPTPDQLLGVASAGPSSGNIPFFIQGKNPFKSKGVKGAPESGH